MRYVAQIPARIGSKRVKAKNLRLMDGKPMVQYAIDACLQVESIGKVYVNTDSAVIGELAVMLGADYYKRKPELATDTAKQDEFNADFMRSIDCDAVVMVNSVAPLIEADDIRGAIQLFERNELDTLIACRQERLHAFYQGLPLNFESDQMLPATQDIDSVDICTWSVCIWRKKTFLESYNSKGYAAFSGKVGMYPMSPINTLKVSYENDFQLAEHILKWRASSAGLSEPEYFDPSSGG